MHYEEKLVHTIKTPFNYYLYDTNTNSILKIDKDICEFFDGDTRIDVRDKLNKLKRLGYLSDNKLTEIAHSADELLEYYLASRLHLLLLQVTQQCNLRCEYCAYSGSYINRSHSDKVMSFELAAKGIDYIITHAADSSNISIGFYGGEPLLEMDLIEKCMKYAKEKAGPKSVSFTITTNGTLLNEKNVKILYENNVMLLVSLDGSREIHDKNRKFTHNGKGSFDAIIKNLEFIKESYPDYFKLIRYNAVLDPENDFSCVNNFFTTYETIKESNIRSSLISQMYKNNNNNENNDEISRYKEKYNYELFKLYLSKLGKLEERHVSKIVEQYFISIQRTFFSERKRTCELSCKGHHSGPCIPGVSRMFMDINGKFYPCERVSEQSEPMIIGDIHNGFDMEKVRTLLNIGKLTEEECKKCWALRLCELCAMSADAVNCLSRDKKLESCERMKKTTHSMLKQYCILRELGVQFKNVNVPSFIDIM